MWILPRRPLRPGILRAGTLPLVAGFLAALLIGCASSEKGYMLPETDEGNQAAAGAYAADGMHFRKTVPDRRKYVPWEFYYKHCAGTGDEVYFSKTSYECNAPY